MAKYLKLFNEHSEYKSFIQTEDFIRPNVSYCIEENEVHYNPLPNANGHEYVDLGLPSGTLWATMNVGATGIGDSGLFFAWGETSGYTNAQVTGSPQEKAFSWDDYKYGTSSSNLTKYNISDGLTELELADDAAHVNWGGDWHMPTREQWQELIANTTHYYGNLGGYYGHRFASTADASAQIKFPSAGYCNNGSVQFDSQDGTFYCWSNSLKVDGVNYAWQMYCNNKAQVLMVGSVWQRYYGLKVRGVLG